MIEETREYLRLLGIDEQRLRVKWISASGGAEFAEEIREFDRVLESLGGNPFPAQRAWDPAEPSRPEEADPEVTAPRLTQDQVEYCMECSNCLGTCPVSRENPRFSPKLMIRQASLGLEENIIRSREVWSCLGCGQCETRCPAGIEIAEFNRSYRPRARQAGYQPLESHHGILQSLARFQIHPIRQRRIGWAEQAGKIRETGDVFYFVGCLPYFDVTFRYLGLSPLEMAKSALTLLNGIGVEPVVSNEERCCGHDALCSGDEETFRRLALWNLETIKASGAKTVLFGCPEGYAAFQSYYPRYFGKLPFEVMHLTDYLSRELPRFRLRFRPASGERITYQDPCRLGRWSGIYDQPRLLMNLVPGTELVEMERARENALCCGTSAWMECSQCSKSLQLERLLEARQTGAAGLITACPKCLIHLTCAKSNENIDIQVKDIYTYLAERLEG